MKANADSVRGMAVNHIGFNYNLLPAEHQAQRQSLTHGDLRARTHVKAAQTYISRAGDARRVAPIEADIDDQS